jgi:hypothetical protein
MQKKAAGTLKRPSLAEIFSPALRKVTIVTTLMFAMAYGAAFGAIQQMPRIVPGTPQVAPLAPERPLPQDPAGAAQWRAESGRMKQQTAAAVQWWQEIGGLAGRTLLAMLVIVIASRRRLLQLFQIPGLIVVPLVFWLAPAWDVSTLKLGMFFAGFFTVAQFSFWGNYLPRVFPTHLRGTGEGFAANVGGRMLGHRLRLRDRRRWRRIVSGPPHVQLAQGAALVSRSLCTSAAWRSVLCSRSPRASNFPSSPPGAENRLAGAHFGHREAPRPQVNPRALPTEWARSLH